MDYLNFFKPLTWSKRTLRRSTSLLHNLCTSTRLDKTDYPNFYTLYGGQNGLSKFFARVIYALRWTKQTVRSSTSFQYALQRSKRTLRTSTILLHALPWSKRALRTSTSFLHSLRWSKLTHRTSSFLQHGLRWTKRTLRASITRFVVVKTDSPNLYSIITSEQWRQWHTCIQ